MKMYSMAMWHSRFIDFGGTGPLTTVFVYNQEIEQLGNSDGRRLKKNVICDLHKK